MRWTLPMLLLTVGCGSGPTGPTPPPPSPPPPATQTVTVALTDTVSGASLGSSTQTISGFPVNLTLLVPGYVPRQAWIRSAADTVDLIPEAGFDLAFYRQFARNGYEAPGAFEPLRVLSQSPSVYLQSTGLSAANVAALEQAARVAVDVFSGHRLGVVTFESGADLRLDQPAWIVAEVLDDANAPCGRGLVGAPAGHLWLNANAKCQYLANRVDPSVMGHELGHALGFWHVPNDGALMSNVRHEWGSVIVTAPERTHAAIAYHRAAGNRDVDSDPLSSASSAAMMVID